MFRYDAEDGQYIHNLSLGMLGSGEWAPVVELDDGKSYEVNIPVGNE